MLYYNANIAKLIKIKNLVRLIIFCMLDKIQFNEYFLSIKIIFFIYFLLYLCIKR